jgi:hypothetical protein
MTIPHPAAISLGVWLIPPISGWVLLNVDSSAGYLLHGFVHEEVADHDALEPCKLLCEPAAAQQLPAPGTLFHLPDSS